MSVNRLHSLDSHQKKLTKITRQSKMSAKNLNSVQEFYKNKTIFITGGSGFMGKVLIEKLLYSCSDLKQIIVLMRQKRGKTGEMRVKEFENLPVSIEILLERK